MKRVLSIAAVALLAAGTSACGEHPMYAENRWLQMQLSMEDSVATATGETLQLSVTAHDARGRPAEPPVLIWETNAPKIAIVDRDGRVTAIRDGVALITAHAGSAGSASTRVYVKATVKSFAWISSVANPDRSVDNNRDSTSVVVRRGTR